MHPFALRSEDTEDFGCLVGLSIMLMVLP